MGGGRVPAFSCVNAFLCRATTTWSFHSPPHPPDSLATSIISHANAGDLHKAVSLFADNPASAPLPDSTYADLLRLCSYNSALSEARRIQSHLLRANPHPPTFLVNRAIETLAKCGGIAYARKLFDDMPGRDGGTWNAMLIAYAQGGLSQEALSLFSRMNLTGVRGNHITFATVLGACSDLLALPLVMQIHGFIIKFGYGSNVILGSSLVDCYGKCQVMNEAQRVFDVMPMRNSITWNVIVRRYLEADRAEESVLMFFWMIRDGVSPMDHTVVGALKACASMLALEEGQLIHGIVVKVGFNGNNQVGSSLIDMYGKCGMLGNARHYFDQQGSRDVSSWTAIIWLYVVNGRAEEAEKLFSEMPVRNVVSWNAMLAGYVQSLCWEKALHFIFWMQRETEVVDHVTLGLILNVCSGLSDLEKGRQVHGYAYRRGFFSICSVGNSLLDMYGKCGSLKAAETWFHLMGSLRDRVSWNTLIRSFACHKFNDLALSAFREMQQEATPDGFTFGSALAAAANLFALNLGKQIHGHMITNGYGQGAVLSAALINMYSKCRSLQCAARVFERENSRDLILWNSLLLSCSYNGYGQGALDLFEVMESEEIRGDDVTFMGILHACVSEGFIDLGQKYFNLMSDKYCVIPLVEHYDCMIDLFGKHGHMKQLEEFISTMPFEPTVSMWMRIFDYCHKYGNSTLGEEAARCINKFNSQDPVRFQVIQDSTLSM